MNGPESGPVAYRDAIVDAAIRQAQNTAAVRGADWRIGTVTAVGASGTVDVGDIRARVLDSYLNPTVGDQIVIAQNSMRNWIAAGRTASTTVNGWTTYTPTWTASGTNPTLGNATLVGRLQKLGRTVVCHINLTVGSTTSVGSGNYSFALPAQAANAGCTYVGSAHLLGTGTGSARWGGQFVVSPNAVTGAAFFPTSTSNNALSWMTQAVPETCTSGDQLRITITYESAT
ncbi:hypothetical protein [Streptomyces sp. NPDC054784]